MKKRFVIRRDGDAFFVDDNESNQVIASLKLKEWESNFFNKKIGILFINEGVTDFFLYKAINVTFKKFLSLADESCFDLIELNLDIQKIKIIPYFEAKGFYLVDTKITFLTLMIKNNLEKFTSKKVIMKLATKKELKGILNLTQQMLIENPTFFSRFKNNIIFSREDTKNYFLAWVENHLEDKDTFFVVSKKRESILGFFIYKRIGKTNDTQVYKGILTAVSPEFKGLKLHLSMQSYLYDHFPEEQFYLDNTTQLTNFATLNNHISSQKKLQKIELIFYRLRNKKNIL
jgi:hypothetical protein